MSGSKNAALLVSTIVLLGSGAATIASAQESNLIYSPVSPCRIFDTRNAGGIMTSGETRSFFVYGDSSVIGGQGGNSDVGCEAPHGEPVAVHLNITVVPSTSGHIRVYPKGPISASSTVNFTPGVAIANAITVRSKFDLMDSDISVYSAGTTHVLADVQGYYYPKMKNVITVSPQYGDFTNPIDAINSIPTTGPDIPSQTNPYLIEIGPGTYNLGFNQQLVMREWVDIKGTGSREATRLIADVSSASASTSAAVVVGANNAELTDLTVVNNSTGTVVIAIANDGAAPKMRRVRARAVSGGSDRIAVYNANANPLMSNVNAAADGGSNNYGVYNSNASPRMLSVTASAVNGTNNTAVYNTGASSQPEIRDLIATAYDGLGENTGLWADANSSPLVLGSYIEGDDWAIYTAGTASLGISSSVVFSDGGATAGGTYLNNGCFFVTNETVALDSNCLVPSP